MSHHCLIPHKSRAVSTREMKSAMLIAIALVASAQSLQMSTCTSHLLSPRPLLPRPLRHSIIRLDGSAASDSEKGLVTLASLDINSRDILDFELNERNKERFLEGKSQYDSIEAMIKEYVDFEGRDKGMSYAECEDQVLRYLQKRALLSEGADGLTDPQTILTLFLLGALILGVVGNALGLTNIPLPGKDFA